MREDDTHELPIHEHREWNIYDDDVREQLVESDALNPEEEAFMRGYEDM